MATEIHMHSDAELSDWFDNDEYLYGEARRATSFAPLEELAGDLFIYNDDQLAEFKSDWEDGRWD